MLREEMHHSMAFSSQSNFNFMLSESMNLWPILGAGHGQ